MLWCMSVYNGACLFVDHRVEGSALRDGEGVSHKAADSAETAHRVPGRSPDKESRSDEAVGQCQNQREK